MDDSGGISTAQARQLSVLWTKAHPIVSAYFRACLWDFHQAEDLLQETAAAAAEKFTTYDPARSFTSWVLGIARNKLLHHHRTHANDRHVFDDTTVNKLAEVYADMEPEISAMHAALEGCIDRVQGRPRKLLEMRLRPRTDAGKDRGDVRHERQRGDGDAASRAANAAGVHRTPVSRSQPSQVLARNLLMRDPSEIMSAYFDDSLAEGEREELRAWLVADPERMRQFVLESVIHSRLRDVLVQQDMLGLVVGDSIDPQHVASLLDEEEAASARRARAAAEQARLAELNAARQEELLDRKSLRIDEPRSPKWPVYASFAAAAALLLIVGRLTSPAPKLEPSRRAVIAAAGPPVIAELSRAFDAAVHSEIRPVATGAKLHAGVLRFDRGVAELKFVSGAKLVVEAPAELELMSADRAKLISGRAVAHVPQEALGFTLHSQAAAFVDLGTEFGVEVDASGDAAIHVLDGEVALVRKHSARKNAAERCRSGKPAR